jgi:hypothetical protein
MGVGVWIAFMGKPSTALALAVGLFLCLIYTKKYSIKLSAVAVFILCVLLIATAFVIDGGVIDFIKRFQLGMEFGQILVDKLNNILRIDGFEFWEVMPHIILSVIVLLIAVSSGMAKNNLHKYVGVFILGLLLAVILNVLLGQSDFTFDMVRRFQGLLIFIIVFASSIAGVVLQRSFGGYKLNILKLAPFFLVMPHIYAFGTSSNYWMVGGGPLYFG